MMAIGRKLASNKRTQRNIEIDISSIKIFD